MENLPELFPQQKEGFERFKKSPGYFGLFFSTGSGKSRAAIECLRYIYNINSGIQPTLIVAPIVMLEKWKREIVKYSKIPASDIVILHGDPKKKGKILSKAHGKIVITNYESFLSDMVKNWFAQNQPKAIIADEIHFIKTHNSARTKAIHAIAKGSTYRIGLTATAILNGSMDLWSQIYFLDLGKRFGDRFHFFKTKYFYDKNAGMPSHVHFPNWQIRPGAEDEIREKVAECSMSYKNDIGIPLVPEIVYCDMSPEQRKAYEDLRREFITYVNDVACVAHLAITKALRMQQILCGFMPLEDGTGHDFKTNHRLETLKGLIELLHENHKIVIWSPWIPSHKHIAKLCEKLQVKYVSLTGAQNKHEKDEAIAAFENDPEVRVCIGNQSVGIGIDLLASDVSIYYSRNFNLAHDIQSEGRNYREGSQARFDKVTRYDIVCPDTLDEQIMEALKNKKEIGARLLKDFSVEMQKPVT